MKQLKFLIFILSIFALYIGADTAFHPEALRGQKDFSQQKSNFGKTHFIVGYDDYDLEHEDVQEITKNDIDVSESLADGIICLDKEGKMCSALFAPDHNLRAALRHLIQSEQEKIAIAIYAFTDLHVANDLIKAHNRGVKIEVIVDPSCLRSQYHKVDDLKDAGIAVYVYKGGAKRGSSGIMHNKFALFSKTVHNKKILWTGSFNFTKSASDTNQENVLLLDDPKIIGAYSDQFEKLKDRAEKLRGATKTVMNKKCSITTIPS